MPELPRQPEVEHLHVPVVGHHHVARLDVAVHDALGVGGAERRGDLPRDVEQASARSRSSRAITVFSVDAVQPLHRDELPALVGVHVVDGADVRVAEQRDGGGFAREATDRVWSSASSSGRNLSATLRGSRRSSASYTTPMPAGAELAGDPVVADGQAEHELAEAFAMHGIARLYTQKPPALRPRYVARRQSRAYDCCEPTPDDRAPQGRLPTRDSPRRAHQRRTDDRARRPRARTAIGLAVEALLQRCLPGLRRWAHGRLPPAARGSLDTQRSGAGDRAARAAAAGSLRAASRRRDAGLPAAVGHQPHPRRGAQGQPSSVAGRTAGRSRVGSTRRRSKWRCRREAYQHYREALDGLASRDRELVVARIEAQWSVAEIAKRFEMPTTGRRAHGGRPRDQAAHDEAARQDRILTPLRPWRRRRGRSSARPTPVRPFARCCARAARPTSAACPDTPSTRGCRSGAPRT